MKKKYVLIKYVNRFWHTADLIYYENGEQKKLTEINKRYCW